MNQAVKRKMFIKRKAKLFKKKEVSKETEKVYQKKN